MKIDQINDALLFLNIIICITAKYPINKNMTQQIIDRIKYTEDKGILSLFLSFKSILSIKL